MNEHWRPHVVRPGEGTTELAFRRGTTAQKVWEHPKNAELAEQRDNPDVLEPGDLIWLPVSPDGEESELSLEAENAFEAEVPMKLVTIRLRDDADEPLSDVAYKVHDIDGVQDDQSGTTDGGGTVKIKVPVVARQVRIVLPEMSLVMPVWVGGMSPLATSTGAMSRLANLGYYTLAIRTSDEEDQQRRLAITQFQLDYGLKVDGTLNATVVARLGQLVGSDDGGAAKACPDTNGTDEGEADVPV